MVEILECRWCCTLFLKPACPSPAKPLSTGRLLGSVKSADGAWWRMGPERQRPTWVPLNRIASTVRPLDPLRGGYEGGGQCATSTQAFSGKVDFRVTPRACARGHCEQKAPRTHAPSKSARLPLFNFNVISLWFRHRYGFWGRCVSDTTPTPNAKLQSAATVKQSGIQALRIPVLFLLLYCTFPEPAQPFGCINYIV